MKKTILTLVALTALLLPAAGSTAVIHNLTAVGSPTPTRAGCHQQFSLGSDAEAGTVFTVRGLWNGWTQTLGQVVYNSGPYAPTYFTVRVYPGTTWVWVEQGRVPHTSAQVPVTC